MSFGFLSDRVKLIKVKDHSTADTTAVNSDGVDMDQDGGYEGVLFMTSFGTAAANNTLEASGSSDNSSFSDYASTQVASGTSDEDVWIDIYKPIHRYVRVEAARGTSSTLESIWAVLYGPRKTMAVDNTTSGTITGEAHLSPATGTA